MLAGQLSGLSAVPGLIHGGLLLMLACLAQVSRLDAFGLASLSVMTTSRRNLLTLPGVILAVILHGEVRILIVSQILLLSFVSFQLVHAFLECLLHLELLG